MLYRCVYNLLNYYVEIARFESLERATSPPIPVGGIRMLKARSETTPAYPENSGHLFLQLCNNLLKCKHQDKTTHLNIGN